MFDIQEELKKLPVKPGVYIMHDESDEIIYVGKAVILRNRVKQYFQKSRNKGPKIERMVTKIARFEYIITDSEVEALVLESNLIKEHRPKYNTMLKDDKNYPFIKVTLGETYPRVLYVRRMSKDESKYYGPYPNAGAAKEVVELVRKLYNLRTCNRSLPRDTGKDRPCLYYHIGQCAAPCQGYVSEEEYRSGVEEAIHFLNGNDREIRTELTQRMQEASDQMDYEQALKYRDLLTSIDAVREHQKITGSDGEDKDVIALATDRTDAVVQVFFVRDGKLIGRDHFYLRIAEGDTTSQVLQSFVEQFYAGTPFVPHELMLQEEIEDMEVIEQWLTKKRGKRVYVRVPKKGTKEKLVELAARNAQLVLDQDRERIKREEGRTIGAVGEIASLLGVEHIGRIEAYDISNISGYDSVGSMVVYEKGKPKRSDYRKFRIKWVMGANDYASMEEVLTRRFRRALDESEGFTRFPDLVLMDGGRGQVNIALKVLDELGLSIPVCGMVKDDNHRTRGLYFDNKELPLPHNSEGFKLITRIQDEAHRFAIEYHRMLRGKGQVHSILDDIPGVGPTRRKALMKCFQTLDDIKNATVEELAAVPSMNEASAGQVFGFFHTGDQNRDLK